MSKAANLGKSFDQSADRGGKALSSSFGSCTGWIADMAVRSEVMGQPTEADGSPEFHVPIVGKVFGDVAAGAFHANEIGPQVQHHRCLAQSAVDTHAEFFLGRGPALIGWHVGMKQEGLEAVVEPKLAARDVEQRTVAAVTIQKCQFAGGRCGQ